MPSESVQKSREVLRRGFLATAKRAVGNGVFQGKAVWPCCSFAGKSRHSADASRTEIQSDAEPKAAPAFNQDGIGVDSFNLTCSHKACSCIARVRRSRNCRTGMTRWHSISQCCGSSVAVYDSISWSLILYDRGPVLASLPEFTGRSPELTDQPEIHYTLFLSNLS